MPTRIPGLDGVRAISILLVLVHHFYRPPADRPTLVQFVDRGNFGVHIFFILSGFLITHLLLKEEQAHGSISLRLFYARRALRILPPIILFLLSLALATAVGILEIPTVDLLAGLSFIRNYVGTSKETTHLWSLAIEEQYYLFWPMTLILVRNSSARVAITAGIIILTPFWIRMIFNNALATGTRVNDLRTDLLLSPFAFGSLMALMLASPRLNWVLTNPIARSPWVAAGSFVMIGITLCTNVLDIPVVRAFEPTIKWLLVVVFINSVIHDRQSIQTRLLELKPMVWLGVLSYSIYIWQQPFSLVVIKDTPKWFQVFPVSLCLAFAFALSSYYLVERPLISLRGKLRREALQPTPDASKPA